MNFTQFSRLILKNAMLLFSSALLCAAAVLVLTIDQKKSYSSWALVNTGLVSGYNLESQQGAKVDREYTRSELANIINLAQSYETMEVLAIRLLAFALQKAQPDLELSARGFQELQELVPADIRKALVVPNNPQKTYQNLVEHLKTNFEGPIYELIYSDHDLVGVEHLQGIKVAREGASDMLKISYSTSDPGMCQKTISLLIETFISKHKALKKGQSTSVLEFFERSTQAAIDRLREAEDELLAFRVENKIINYYEQTRFISSKKEDLDESYHNELMALVAADSAVSMVEEQLNGNATLPELREEVSRHMDDYSALNRQLSTLALQQTTAENTRKMGELKLQIDSIQRLIKANTDLIYQNKFSTSGTEVESLLGSWLDNMLAMQTATARMQLIRERKNEFKKIYEDFAPLGSKLKRIERAIEVAESEYLENLHSLNQARLHNYSLLMSSNLQVTDAPFYPAKPASSKRLVLVIVGFLVGLVLPLSGILAAAFLDSNLKSPQNAVDVTGLPLAGAFPRVLPSLKKQRKVDMPLVMERCQNLLAQQVILFLKQNSQPLTQNKVLVFSTRSQEGKSFVAEQLAQALQKKGIAVAMNAQTVNENPKALQVFELPALLESPFSIEQVAEADLSLLVCRANRGWNAADQKALALYAQAGGSQPQLIINGTEIEALEDYIGEIPKVRSPLRKWLKKLTALHFSEGNSL